MALLNVHQLSVSFGGTPLFNQVGFTVEPGNRICLIGRNGSGKSTLIRVLAGEMDPTDGTLARANGVRVRALPQNVPDGLSGSALDVATEFHGAGALDDDPESAGERRLQAEQTLTRLGVATDARVEEMSGGELRRVLLAATLATDWDVLLLDEPTNHLDIDSIEWLEQTLLSATRSGGRAVLFVSHDRAFSRAVADRVIALDRGSLYRFPGGYDEFVRRQQDAIAAETRQEAAFDRVLAAEEEWLRRGVKARRTRNEGRVRALMEMRAQYAERRSRQGTARMRIAEAARSGDLVVEMKDLAFSWDRRRIVDGLNTTILKGDRVGIVGPNGAGKTTLVRLLLGDLQPAAGTVRRGSGLQVVYFDQLRRQLDETETLYHAFGGGYDTVEVGGARKHVLAYMQDFLFSADDRNRPVHTLSGGERNRVLLARLFARPSNLLVLDEPTNDLDQETLELLEDLLSDYGGTLLLVSHDRDFLDNVVTDCLVLAGDGRVEEHAGGYREWMARYHHLRSPEGPGSGDSGAVGATGNAEASRRRRERRLGFRERRELEELPDRIEALETEQAEIHRQLADPSLYETDDGTRTTALTDRLAAIEGELEAAYARWEELSAIESQGSP